MLQYTLEDVQSAFPSQYFSRGQLYQQQGRADGLNISQQGRVITGLVTGNDVKPYKVYVQIKSNSRDIEIEGDCTCPVGYNCKHVVAVLLEGLHRNGDGSDFDVKIQSRNEFTFNNQPAPLAQAITQQTTDEYPAGVNQRLLYVLDIVENHSRSFLSVDFFTARIRKDGGYGKPRRYYISGTWLAFPAKFLLQKDVAILCALKTQDDLVTTGQSKISPFNKESGIILEQIIATGRCYWRSLDTPALSLEGPRKAQLQWILHPDGKQTPRFEVVPPAEYILPLQSPWYLDIATHCCGPLETGLPDKVTASMATTSVSVERAAQYGLELSKRCAGLSVPLPKVYSVIKNGIAQPVPHLKLFLQSIKISAQARRNHSSQYENVELARLSFNYNGLLVNAALKCESVLQPHDGQLLEIPRNLQLEQEVLAKLSAFGFVAAAKSEEFVAAKENLNDLYLPGPRRHKDLIIFSVKVVPELRRLGWQIEIDADYPYRVAEGVEWYADLKKVEKKDWFGLELGVIVDQQHINLLPVLLSLLHDYAQERNLRALKDLPEDQLLYATLEDGRLLPLPVSRVQTILSPLIEMYDLEGLNERGELSVSKLQAAQLAELESAMPEGGFHWLKKEGLVELGRKLAGFTGIQSIVVPQEFQAALRDYQQQGLNWLQFLREYDLAGILADDMGLGKTVQALAHLLIEKQAGRTVGCPSLVVAPTSLMYNWRREAQQFAPDLNVLILQGTERRQYFDRLSDYDLVLTTYPLLPRDQDVLRGQQYHLLILDEAQIIKNPTSQAAQIVKQLKARHRLCLTGTPIENHLGELWSLYDFLLPGLLGGQREFQREFRTPIEKQGDEIRMDTLRRRTRPFILRRTKDQVVKELPEKTTIVRGVDLQGKQRDLYESIRLALHQKVRMEINNKGLARSQIVILDALLKLRQVCCDPRLLKMPSAQKVTQSAKLEQLLDMLPTQIEEGRKILLFSQFTSMLALIEAELNRHNLEYVKLTGQTKDRAAAVERFQMGEVPLFLISLKAGGTGLNLTAADTVIHYDPWWNPAVEDQATDRAYRIGQDKPVFVYKLITTGTVEEKIVALQARKRELADGLLSGGDVSTQLSPDDLEILFEPLDK